jgi:hypothetical protein
VVSPHHGYGIIIPYASSGITFGLDKRAANVHCSKRRDVVGAQPGAVPVSGGVGGIAVRQGKLRGCYEERARRSQVAEFVGVTMAAPAFWAGRNEKGPARVKGERKAQAGPVSWALQTGGVRRARLRPIAPIFAARPARLGQKSAFARRSSARRRKRPCRGVCGLGQGQSALNARSRSLGRRARHAR